MFVGVSVDCGWGGLRLPVCGLLGGWFLVLLLSVLRSLNHRKRTVQHAHMFLELLEDVAIRYRAFF